MNNIELASRFVTHLELSFIEGNTANATGFLWTSRTGDPFLITNFHVVTGLRWDNLKQIQSDKPHQKPIKLKAHLPFFPGIFELDERKYFDFVDSFLQIELFAPAIIDQAPIDQLIPVYKIHDKFENKVDIVAIPLNVKTTKVVSNGESSQAFTKDYRFIDTISASQSILNLPREYVAERCGLNLVPMVNDMTTEISDDVFVLGFPMGMDGAVKGTPICKRASVATEIGFDYDGVPSYLVDTATSSGMSGSPVVRFQNGLVRKSTSASMFAGDEHGSLKFLGVYSGRFKDHDLGVQLGVVFKAHLVDEIVEAGKLGYSFEEWYEIRGNQNSSK